MTFMILLLNSSWSKSLRHLTLFRQALSCGFTAELHTAEREEIERELFQRLRRRFQRCRIKRAGTGLIVTVRAFAESTAENQRLQWRAADDACAGQSICGVIRHALNRGE